MFIAVISGRSVLEVSTNEQASLEGMQAYSALRRPALRRIVTTAAVYLAFESREIETDLDVTDDGKAVTVFVDAKTKEQIR